MWSCRKKKICLENRAPKIFKDNDVCVYFYTWFVHFFKHKKLVVFVKIGTFLFLGKTQEMLE